MFILIYINFLNKIIINYKVVSNSIKSYHKYIEETTFAEEVIYIKARPPPFIRCRKYFHIIFFHNLNK